LAKKTKKYTFQISTNFRYPSPVAKRLSISARQNCGVEAQWAEVVPNQGEAVVQ
jgi:hypothetical protein